MFRSILDYGLRILHNAVDCRQMSVEGFYNNSINPPYTKFKLPSSLTISSYQNEITAQNSLGWNAWFRQIYFWETVSQRTQFCIH